MTIFSWFVLSRVPLLWIVFLYSKYISDGSGLLSKVLSTLKLKQDLHYNLDNVNC